MLSPRPLLCSQVWAPCREPQRHTFAHGWSLVEVLAVLVLILLAGKLLLPSWAQGLANTQLRQQQQSLLLQLRQARTSAQMQQQRVTVCGWPALSNCSAIPSSRIQLITFVDTNRDGQWQLDERLLHRQTLHRELQVSFNRGAYVQFTPQGTSGQSGTWSLCWQQVPTGQGIVLSSSGNLRTKQVVCDAVD